MSSYFVFVLHISYTFKSCLQENHEVKMKNFQHILHSFLSVLLLICGILCCAMLPRFKTKHSVIPYAILGAFYIITALLGMHATFQKKRHSFIAELVSCVVSLILFLTLGALFFFSYFSTLFSGVFIVLFIGVILTVVDFILAAIICYCMRNTQDPSDEGKIDDKSEFVPLRSNSFDHFHFHSQNRIHRPSISSIKLEKHSPSHL